MDQFGLVCLYLLQDAAGGSEAIKMFVYHLSRNIADLLIGETLDRIHLSGHRGAKKQTSVNKTTVRVHRHASSSLQLRHFYTESTRQRHTEGSPITRLLLI